MQPAIKLTKEKATEWLSEFIDRVNTQDNRGTASPYIFCVQSLEFVYWSEEEMHADKIRKHTAEDFTEDEPIEGYDHYNYIDQAWFFTEEGAKDHLMLNSHNYKEPRIYVKHCFRSYEIQELLQSVAVLVGKEYGRR